MANHLPSLQQQFRRLMSREITRSHQMLASLGSMRSEQRLAAFLLNLSQRYASLGYSSTEFVLRMSREEIGNYLGLTLETVSRLFSRFARDGLIRINQREVRILDQPALKQLLGHEGLSLIHISRRAGAGRHFRAAGRHHRPPPAAHHAVLRPVVGLRAGHQRQALRRDVYKRQGEQIRAERDRWKTVIDRAQIKLQ